MSWLERAACRHDPDMWFTGAHRTAAVHICRQHCPVIEECYEALQRTSISFGVMAGVAFAADGVPTARAGVGKAANVCGPDCQAYRKEV